jgi:hypothetical protein
MKVTQAYLKSILAYDQATGTLRWKITRGRAKTGDVPGWIDNAGHRYMKVLDIETTASRFVWLYFHGTMPDLYLEHINGKKLDDNIDNLRLPIDRSKTPLTADRLRELLHYDPETGLFTWLVTTPKKTRGKLGGFHSDQGYLLLGLDGNKYRIHRLAWLYVYGCWPDGDLDHIDGNPSNNRIANLREATDAQNLANSKKPITNRSGYKGVSWHAGAGKWHAGIRHNGRSIYLGLFTDPAVAHAAYCKASKKLNGRFARFS